MDRVTVSAYGNLKNRLGKETTVPAGQSIAQAIESLQGGVTDGLPITPVINGRVVTWDYVLQPGDALTLVPTIGGGNCGQDEKKD